jgi:hypothetical protein
LPGLPEIATEAKVGLSKIITTRLTKLAINLTNLAKLEIRIIVS